MSKVSPLLPEQPPALYGFLDARVPSAPDRASPVNRFCLFHSLCP